MRTIKRFSDGSYLEYGRGNFDDWCVYFTSSTGERHAPRDTEYFQNIKDLAVKYGTECVYEDYVSIYNRTGKEIDESVFELITQISQEYDNDANLVDIVFSVLYMAMIAEERRKYTKLGRRIKRIGIYFLLYEDASVDYAANFMRDMKWYQIAELCEERGF